MYPASCQLISMTSPAKPNRQSLMTVWPQFLRIALRISCQVYPRTSPPMRFGMKKTVRKKFVPRSLRVRK